MWQLSQTSVKKIFIQIQSNFEELNLEIEKLKDEVIVREQENSYLARLLQKT